MHETASLFSNFERGCAWLEYVENEQYEGSPKFSVCSGHCEVLENTMVLPREYADDRAIVKKEPFCVTNNLECQQHCLNQMLTEPCVPIITLWFSWGEQSVFTASLLCRLK